MIELAILLGFLTIIVIVFGLMLLAQIDKLHAAIAELKPKRRQRRKPAAAKKAPAKAKKNQNALSSVIEQTK